MNSKSHNILLLLVISAISFNGQTEIQAAGQSVPLYKVTVSQSSAKAINYEHLRGSTKINLKGTVLLPSAEGTAEVEGKQTGVSIEAKLKHLEPASRFGAEYLTYVLWAISPSGRAENLGEVVPDEDGNAKIKATTNLQAFGLIVSAEPYFAVTQVSSVVALENAVRKDTSGKVEQIDAKFDLLEHGQYTTNAAPSEMQAMKMEKGVPLEVYEARNAVKIAKAAGAEKYAPEAYSQADERLQQMEKDLLQKRDKKRIVSTARVAVQKAEDARLIAVKQQEQERLTNERQQSKDQLTQATAQADQAHQQAAQATSEAEKARQSAESAASQTQQAQKDAAAALAAQQAAMTEVQQAKSQAAQAELARQQAENDRENLRAQLQQQLNLILETRDTARGLIINMSDVLFETAQYELKPAFREKLAKIAGILVSHPGLKLSVEGHTDSVGSASYNQTLSERRASAVRDYLVSQGVPAASITSIGFGKTRPVDSNETGSGRARNRRVELVVSGHALGPYRGHP